MVNTTKSIHVRTAKFISRTVFVLKNGMKQCTCPESFFDLKCEIADSRIVILYESNIQNRSLVLIHLIETLGRMEPHTHTTVVKVISFDIDNVTVSRFNLFHAETEHKTYYLVPFRQIQTPSNITSV